MASNVVAERLKQLEETEQVWLVIESKLTLDESSINESERDLCVRKQVHILDMKEASKELSGAALMSYTLFTRNLAQGLVI